MAGWVAGGYMWGKERGGGLRFPRATLKLPNSRDPLLLLSLSFSSPPIRFFFFLLPFFVGLCAPCDTGGFSWPSSSCTFLLLFSSSSASFPFPLPLPVLRPFSRMLWPWYWRVKRYFFNPRVYYYIPPPSALLHRIPTAFVRPRTTDRPPHS